MLSYMKKLNLPIALGEDWDEENFEIQSLFNFHPELAFDLFFDLKLRWCGNKFCGDPIATWTYDSNTNEDSLNIMRNLKADDKLIQAAAADFASFLEDKLPVQSAYTEIIPAPHYEPPNYERDTPKQTWLGIIKDYLIHLDGNPKRAFEGLQYNYRRYPLHYVLSDIFKNLSKRFIANVFSAAFASKYQKAFIVYSFTKQEEKTYGTKRSYQRFEQCVEFLESNMRLAFDALLAQKLFDKSVQAAAIEMAWEVIEDLTLHYHIMEEKWNDHYYSKQLKVIELIVMFPDDATNVTKIVEAYKDLKLDGSESLVEMYVEIAIFNNTDRLTVFEQELKTISKYKMFKKFNIN